MKRLAATTRNAAAGARPKTFAIVPLQPNLEAAPIAHRLANALTEMGIARRGARQSGRASRARNGSTLSRRRMTWCSIAATRPTVPGRINACARPTAFSCLRAPTSLCRSARSICPRSRSAPRGLPELLLLHPSGQWPALPEHFSLRSGLFESHHHIRAGNSDDIRAAGALHRRARGGTGAGGRRRAGLRPYRHHQGADGGRRPVRSSGRHLDGRDHRGGPGQ